MGATLDPVSYFKIGQVVEAKVHQLDFALERIFLSLKEITPDPLIETLESVVGGCDPLDGRLQAAQAETEVILPPTTNIPEAYAHESGEEQAFIQNLALFFTSFYKGILTPWATA